MQSWDLNFKSGYYNFDYGLYDKTNNTWFDANHDQPGMIIYEKTLKQYSEPLTDFNRQVFCIATTTLQLK